MKRRKNRIPTVKLNTCTDLFPNKHSTSPSIAKESDRRERHVTPPNPDSLKGLATANSTENARKEYSPSSPLVPQPPSPIYSSIYPFSPTILASGSNQIHSQYSIRSSHTRESLVLPPDNATIAPTASPTPHPTNMLCRSLPFPLLLVTRRILLQPPQHHGEDFQVVTQLETRKPIHHRFHSLISPNPTRSQTPIPVDLLAILLVCPKQQLQIDRTLAVSQ